MTDCQGWKHGITSSTKQSASWQATLRSMYSVLGLGTLARACLSTVTGQCVPLTSTLSSMLRNMMWPKTDKRSLHIFNTVRYAHLKHFVVTVKEWLSTSKNNNYPENTRVLKYDVIEAYLLVATSALGKKLFLVSISRITWACGLLKKFNWKSKAFVESGSAAGISKPYITWNQTYKLPMTLNTDLKA